LIEVETIKKRRLKYGKNRDGFSFYLKKIGQDQQDYRDKTAFGRKGSSPKAKKILSILSKTIKYVKRRRSTK
jgi:hypothetical protein